MSQFIETRFYDDGTAEARLHKERPTEATDAHTEQHDFYIDEIDSLQEWVEENLEGIELDDITPLVLDLEAGLMVEITNYC